MRRVPLTIRALVLLPLLSVAVDQARATVACGPRAETCLEAAGRGWMGAAGVALVLLYSVAFAFGVGRLARGGHHAERGRVPLLKAWAGGTLAVALACGGQALLASVLGNPAALGGGWVPLLAFCAAAGAILA